jgi:hypothetical protein
MAGQVAVRKPAPLPFGVSMSGMPFEELDCTLMLLSGSQGGESPQISTALRLWICLSAIQPILTGT